MDNMRTKKRIPPYTVTQCCRCPELLGLIASCAGLDRVPLHLCPHYICVHSFGSRCINAELGRVCGPRHAPQWSPLPLPHANAHAWVPRWAPWHWLVGSTTGHDASLRSNATHRDGTSDAHANSGQSNGCTDGVNGVCDRASGRWEGWMRKGASAMTVCKKVLRPPPRHTSCMDVRVPHCLVPEDICADPI